jgi:large subunit ribosomal protein L18
VSGSEEKPRLAIYKSLRYIYAQVIDDVQGTTLAQANSGEAAIRKAGKGAAKNLDAARLGRCAIEGTRVLETAKER